MAQRCDNWRHQISSEFSRKDGIMAHGGVRHPDLASSSFRIRRKMTFIALPGLVRALCFLAAAAAELVFCTEADSAPATLPKTIEQEIAAIQAEIDAIEEAAIAGIPSLLPGSPERLPALGKMLFFERTFRQSQRGMRVLPYAADGLPGSHRKSQSG
jgi:hypothetical protein